MVTLVHIGLTEDQCLDARMAFNAAAISWGAKAQAAREAGNTQEAQSCECIRADYNALWEKVAAAQRDTDAFNREALATALAANPPGGSATLFKLRAKFAE